MSFRRERSDLINSNGESCVEYSLQTEELLEGWLNERNKDYLRSLLIHKLLSEVPRIHSLMTRKRSENRELETLLSGLNLAYLGNRLNKAPQLVEILPDENSDSLVTP